MALPATPPLSLQQVCVEFGAPLNTPLSAFLRGGAWVPNSPANANVPTVLPISLLQLLGAAAGGGGGGTVALSNHFDSTGGLLGDTISISVSLSSGGPLPNAYFTLQPGSVDVDFPGEWLVSGNPGDFEVFATQVIVTGNGTNTGDAVGVWLPLNVTRSWGRTKSAQVGETVRIVTLQIRRIDTPGTILATGQMSMTATRDA